MRAEIEMEYADLEAGDSRRGVCPKCKGGSSGERSLNVTRSDEGAILYLCWRASCDVRGVIGGSPTRLASLVASRPKLVRTKPDPSHRFNPLEGGDWANVWEFHWTTLDSFGVMYDPETQRLAVPVFSPVGRVRGWVLRSLDRSVTPKTLAVPTSPEPQLGWNAYHGGSADVIVVEDIPSCIRLGEFNVRAVALNGTHMTDEAKDELIAEAENVVFALDRDAFHKAQRLEQAMRLHFNKTATLLLPKDFKNQNNKEVVECLSGISWLRFSDPETRMIESGTSSVLT